MARKARNIQDASSDDDAPEVVSHSASKADAKRGQKVLQDFAAEENARRKARNRDRDRKLKERARLTKGEKMGDKLKEVRLVDQTLESETEGESGDDGEDVDDVEARMLRAMRDAADEVESGEGGDEYEEDDEFRGLGQGMDLGDDMASGSSSFSAQDEDSEDAGISPEESDSIGPEVDEEMEEDEETTSPQANITHKPNRKLDYLADDLFAAAFASQNSNSLPRKSSETTQKQKVKKRRRKSTARAKDLVVGGRTIRTLPRPSDSRSQATARSVPSSRARKFLDQSLAMKGKQSLAKAKKRGWERRPANVGVMKYQGAPHGFARSMR